MSPESLPDLPPEMPPLPSDAATIKAAVGAVIDDCEGLVRSLAGRIRSEVDACLAQGCSTVDDCRSCVEGRLAVLVGEAEGVVGKCRGKILNAAYQAMAAAYDLVGPYLGPPPSIEAVISDLTRPDGAPIRLPPGFLGPPIAGWTPPPEPAPEPGQGPPCDKPSCSPGFIDDPGGNCPPGTIPTPQEPPEWCSTVPDPMNYAQCRPFTCKWGEGGEKEPPEPPGPGPGIPPPDGDGDGDGGTCSGPPIVNVNACCDKEPEEPPEPWEGAAGDADPPGGMSRWNSWNCPEPIDLGQVGSQQALFERFRQWLGIAPGAQGVTPKGPHWIIDVLMSPSKGVRNLCWELSDALLTKLPAWAATLLPSVTGCESAAGMSASAIAVLMGFLDKWLGIVPENVKLSIIQEVNRACPVGLPSVAECNGMRVRGLIDDDLWRCWVRANGSADVPQEKVVDAMRPFPTVDEIFALEFRGLLPKVSTPEVLEKAYGWDRLWTDKLRELRMQLPGPSDLIRLMQRDVADKDVVLKYRLDDEFPQKFQGLLADWSTAQGLTPEVMLAYWRAHWDWPSNTQLYEMFHRLRADNPDLPAGVEPVTEEDILQVLGVNDVAPVWRKRLVAIAAHPVNLIDLRRMYDVGAIDEKRLYHGFRDLGYTEVDAQLMVEYYQVMKLRKIVRDPWQVYSWKELTGWYINGLLNEAEFQMKLTPLVPRDAMPRMVGQANYKRLMKLRQKLVNGVKKRFRRCELGFGDAIAELTAAGLDSQSSALLAESWVQTCKAQEGLKEKAATAQQLCLWLEQGLVTSREFYARMAQAGWSRADAMRIVRSCQIKIAEKAAKKAKEGEEGGKGDGTGERGPGEE